MRGYVLVAAGEETRRDLRGTLGARADTSFTDSSTEALRHILGPTAPRGALLGTSLLDMAVSCKRRGFCPSCLGRRMSDVAAHLSTTCSSRCPSASGFARCRGAFTTLLAHLRCDAMGYDRRLCADVLGAFIGALTRSLRWRAKRQLGLRSVKDALVSAVTFVQRNDSALRLNPRARMARHASHERCHTLALDSVYVRAEDGDLEFHPLVRPVQLVPSPSDLNSA